MPYRLIQNDQTLQEWINLPAKVRLPTGDVVHAIQPGWSLGDFAFESFEPEPVEPSEPVYTAYNVIAERERRLALGFDYNFEDERGTHRIGTTSQDMLGWDEVSKAAQALIALGAGATTIDIVTDTGPVTVTALEWQQVLVAAAAVRQPIWASSFVLQAMDPIPADYVDDSYWE